MVATELTLEAHGVRITVADAGAGGDALFAVAQAAFQAAERTFVATHSFKTSDKRSSSSGGSRAGGSRSARVREIAREILSDGRVHERREISQAVRDAGLPKGAVNSLNGVLDREFHKSQNVYGRPTYRDLSVASPYKDPQQSAGEDKPDWMRSHAPSHEPGDLERLAVTNGAELS